MLERGMTHDEFGEWVGVTGKTVRNWLKRAPTLPQHDELVSLGSLTGRRIEWLLTGRGPEMSVQDRSPASLEHDLGAHVLREVRSRFSDADDILGTRSTANGRALLQRTCELAFEETQDQIAWFHAITPIVAVSHGLASTESALRRLSFSGKVEEEVFDPRDSVKPSKSPTYRKLSTSGVAPKPSALAIEEADRVTQIRKLLVRAGQTLKQVLDFDGCSLVNVVPESAEFDSLRDVSAWAYGDDLLRGIRRVTRRVERGEAVAPPPDTKSFKGGS